MGFFVHFGGSYYFVIYLNLGISGTGYAGLCTFTTNYIVILIFANLQDDIKECRIWPDKRMF